jgi:Rieske Fe-S protein
MPDKETVRRDLVKTIFSGGILLWFGTFLYPVFRYLRPRPEDPTLSAVKSVVAGSTAEMDRFPSKYFKFGSRPGIIIKNENGELRAFSATCTHLGCTVQYDPKVYQFWCACHGGRYNTEGKNVSGPPPKPLTPLKVEVSGADIVVSKI